MNQNHLRSWLEWFKRFFNHHFKNKEELLEQLRDARQWRLLDTDSLNMIEGVLQVADLRVRDIMIPRAEMVSINRNDSFKQILKTAVLSAHSRFPVTGDDRSEIIGILLAKDLLAFCDKSDLRAFNLRDLLRSVVFVPGSKRLNILLKEVRTSRNHMAIVVDEYGNAAGLVTIEDVLEQIVGEIDDEHDYGDELGIFQCDNNKYHVKARTLIEDFNIYFNRNFKHDEFDTIGGLIVNVLGRVPKRGESLEIEFLRFTVMRADSRRVHLLCIEKLNIVS